jgi:hypothetical protein
MDEGEGRARRNVPAASRGSKGDVEGGQDALAGCAEPC